MSHLLTESEWPLISFVLALCSWYQIRSNWELIGKRRSSREAHNSTNKFPLWLAGWHLEWIIIFVSFLVSSCLCCKGHKWQSWWHPPLGCHPEWMIASYYSPPAFCTLSCHQLPVNRCSLFFLNILQSRDPFIADRHCVMSEPAKYMEIMSGFRFSEITTLDNGFLIYTDLWSLALDLESFCVYCF